jgi:hypothetical protein
LRYNKYVPTLKPIPTKALGLSFRSRLEARWALILRYLGIRFQYEAEGYDLSGRYYLPDFYLPDIDCFFEVKGKEPNYEEQMLAYLLSRDSGKFVHIASGSIPLASPSMWGVDGFMLYAFNYKMNPLLETKDIGTRRLYLNDIYSLNECPHCCKVAFCKYGIVSNLPCKCSKLKSGQLSSRIERAFISGRMATFEFKNRK